MSADKISLDEQLAELRKGYVAHLPNKLEELRSSHHAAFNDGLDQDSLFKFYRLAHSLAGSGAIYGFQVIGDKARQLEQLLKPYAEQPAAMPGDLAAQAAQFLDDLDLLVRQASSAPA